MIKKISEEKEYTMTNDNIIGDINKLCMELLLLKNKLFLKDENSLHIARSLLKSYSEIKLKFTNQSFDTNNSNNKSLSPLSHISFSSNIDSDSDTDSDNDSVITSTSDEFSLDKDDEIEKDVNQTMINAMIHRKHELCTKQHILIKKAE